MQHLLPRCIFLLPVLVCLGVLSGAKNTSAADNWTRAETIETYAQIQFQNASKAPLIKDFTALGIGWGVNVTPRTGCNIYFFGGFPKSARFTGGGEREFFGGGDLAFDFYLSPGRFSPFASAGLGYAKYAAAGGEYLSEHFSLGCTWRFSDDLFTKVYYQSKHLEDDDSSRLTGYFVHVGIYMDLDSYIRMFGEEK